MSFLLRQASAAALLCALASRGASAQPRPAGPTRTAAPSGVPDSTAAPGLHATVLAALRTLGVQGTLGLSGPVTLLLPSDAALAGVPRSTRERLQASPDALRALLWAHVIPGHWSAAQLRQVGAVRTQSGQLLRVRHQGLQLRLGPLRLEQGPVEVPGGLVYSVDRVLDAPSPPSRPPAPSSRPLHIVPPG